ncbi:hypothetical protein CEXT_555091 [Caerostris extrusa]|uniref:Uncharacterized protein n=1 Tax=Caerostris extrusa TaxID=172846 RepID=A0AAV4Y2V0_CAEEX|nr:hypothetical protein CEXT_555091 [Caerostris extrusa]
MESPPCIGEVLLCRHYNHCLQIPICPRGATKVCPDQKRMVEHPSPPHSKRVGGGVDNGDKCRRCRNMID